MSEPLRRLLAIMQRLRDPQDGCPWDREQTRESIAPHTIEEAYELADAIGRNDTDDVRDELGDLLFQVVFQAQIASERGLFDFDAVTNGICDKLERRHPHVFGNQRLATAAEQSRAWEAHKAAERLEKQRGQQGSRLDGVAHALPALSRAGKLGRRAAGSGFDWPDAQAVLAKVREEIDEVEEAIDAGQPAHLQEELGDLLFAASQAVRRCGFDPESVLRDANGKFERRFRHMEAALARRGLRPEDVDMQELDALWVAAKQAGA
jgi:MazG family protein